MTSSACDCSISVVVPLFNKAQFVCAVIESFAVQLAPGDEIVVVDDGSSDEGVMLVENVSRRMLVGSLRVLLQVTNSGPATARNVGAAQARGRYLLFFDADDIPHPQLLEILRKSIQRHPDEVMFAYDMAVQAYGDSVNQALSQRFSTVDTRVRPRGAFVSSSLRGKPLCTASSTCVRAVEFLAIGGFQSGLRYCEDPELWARLSACYTLVHIQATMAVYRDVPASLSHQLRGQPGAVGPYVATLLSLRQRRGDDYELLARSFIVRNAIFSLVLGAPRRQVLGAVVAERAVLSGIAFLALRLLICAPRFVSRALIRVNTRRTLKSELVSEQH